MYIVAHRGAEDFELENSMSAFSAAENAGADAIELDVHATKDNQLVVIHDRCADRVAAPTSPFRTNPIASLTLEEVQQIHLSNSQAVPTLQEVLEATKLPIQVELKAPGTVPAIAAHLDAHPEHLHRLLFISFIDSALIELTDRLPDCRVGVLRSEKHPDLHDLQILEDIPQRNLAAYLPSLRALNMSPITELHSRNVRIGCWTIRDEASLALAERAGVDFATVSDPVRFKAVCEEEHSLSW